jgi:CDP-paratose 2-epimerase
LVFVDAVSELKGMLDYRRILVTGGAGFVGSSLALALKGDYPEATVISFDNLRRRGSELTLTRLKAGGVTFQHGDIRNTQDLVEAGPCDLLIDCSAEPSVHAGYGGSPAYVIDTNLVGTINCFEVARAHRADVIFLSTSRVYPIATLRQLPLIEAAERFAIPSQLQGAGWSAKGISTEFPLAGARSLYGATKLAAEILAQEYGAMYDLRIVINRCGVLTGPWQMGKVDQGFVVLWAARHLYGAPLEYMGFGGRGLQVRDILHVEDLYDLIVRQLSNMESHKGLIYNVGGGLSVSVSLAELTRACAARVGRAITVRGEATTRPADVPYYVTDNTRVTEATGWQPSRTVDSILDDIFAWLKTDRLQLQPLLA